MFFKFLVFFVLIDQSLCYEKSMREMGLSLLRPSEVLSLLSKGLNEITSVSEDIFRQQTTLFVKFRNQLLRSIKSFAIVEPDERETEEADEEMGALDLSTAPDSQDKMDQFCENRKKRIEILRVYVKRKYTFNLITRIISGILFDQIEETDDLFCSSDLFKDYFVKNIRQLKEVDVFAVRQRFVDRLNAVLNTTVGVTKAKDLCCSYRRFRNESISLVENIENRVFYMNLLDGYYGEGFKYLCFFYKKNPCRGHLPSQKSTNDFSLLMNVLRSLSKISSVIL